jgi:hypothetical protein
MPNHSKLFKFPGIPHDINKLIHFFRLELEYFNKLHALCEEIYKKVPFIIDTEQVIGRYNIWSANYIDITTRVLMGNKIYCFKSNITLNDRERFYEVKWAPLDEKYSKNLFNVINGYNEIYRFLLITKRMTYLIKSFYIIRVNKKRMNRLAKKSISKNDIALGYTSDNFVYN